MDTGLSALCFLYLGEMKMNKRAQQYYPRNSYTHVHPVLIIGIILFCIPFLLPIIHVSVNAFFKSVFNVSGIMLILIGAVLSIFNASN